jgi:hypothetical protein
MCCYIAPAARTDLRTRFLMELSHSDNFEYGERTHFGERNNLAQDHVRGEFHTSVSSSRHPVQIFLSGFNATLEQEHCSEVEVKFCSPVGLSRCNRNLNSGRNVFYPAERNVDVESCIRSK